MAAPEDPAAPAGSIRPTVAARVPLETAVAASRPSAVYAAIRLVRIGRQEDNDIVVDDMLVSRRHAELRGNRLAGYELVDLDSHNGTFVNGKRIRKARLEQLDVVGIGHAQFRLVDETLEEYVDTGEVSFEALGVTVDIAGGRRLIDNLGLSVRERALVGIVGPSGSGKSTLLNALSGRRPATSGAVLYNGIDLYAHYAELRGRIGVVPQDDVLYRELRVARLLEYAAELAFPPDVSAEERLGRIDEVLRELGLESRRDHRIEQLSGGERKRVSVSIELLTKPSLLFLDEPTSGLDPGYERTLMELFRALADGGRTVFVVTHSIQSLRLCDRVLVLAPGGGQAYFGPPQFAPTYFERDDFQQVFQDLTAGSQVDWAARFREHPDHERYLNVAAVAPEVVEAHREPVPIERRGPWLRQFRTLTRRNLDLLASDRRSLALLVLQAPLLGLILLLALPHGQLGPPPDGTVRLAAKGGLVLLTLVLTMTWLGASNAVRAIVSELPIFTRERSLGVSISAYVASKALVLGGVAILQAVVLVALATARQGGPVDAVVLGSPWLELATAVAAAGLAAVALGLLVSALARRVERAMTVLPVVLIVELILGVGGIAPEIIAQPGLKQLSYVASAQWGFSASASTVGLNDLDPVGNLARAVPTLDLGDPAKAATGFARAFQGESRWDHTASAWTTSMLALLGLWGAALVATGLALRRIDRQRR